ncbi:hypothetical protein [Candidatus Chlamydia corallus]|uniref:hypothetical protein n=1 Tax=Candidatus Chlamydia corallus TaxID=2038470 RepID=UPI000C2FAD13|nr:hypothetical protein [Candidatus Chlamydia corallus]
MKKLYHPTLLLKSLVRLSLILVLSFTLISANIPQQKSFGHCCADMHSALISGKNCEELFTEFIERVLMDKESLSVRDWGTVVVLVRQYLLRCIRQGECEYGVKILQKLLTLRLPKDVRKELQILWQRFNPEQAPLRDIVEQLFNIGCHESLQDHLLFELYTMTLHSSYENRKQDILLAKEQGDYKKALELAKQLIEALEKGSCSPHPEILQIENTFLQKTLLALQIKISQEASESCDALLTPYCFSEIAYTEAVDTLIMRIAKGEVSRTDEVDIVLLNHALQCLPFAREKAIRELEVLIDHGAYLHSTLLYYAYFSLLELYHQNKDFASMERLLERGDAVFIPGHPYFPEYGFFLGANFYAKGNYESAQKVFLEIVDPAIKLGATFAKVYEYLGCIAYVKNHYKKAEEYFLRAYKSWGREESGIGLFLAYVVQKKKTLCQEMLYHPQFSFTYRHLIDSLYSLSYPDLGNENKSESKRGLRALPELSEIYSRCIYDMIKYRNAVYEHPIIELAHNHVRNLEKCNLEEICRETKDPEYYKALAFWEALQSGSKPMSLLEISDVDEARITMRCYEALYCHNPEAIAMLPEAFSEECNSWQTALRIVWTLVRPKGTPNHSKYCDRLALRPHGDSLYFLAYDLQEYLIGDEDALKHLSLFADIFPKSSLLSLVYYMQSYSERSPLRKVGWFIKALEEFSEISWSGEHKKTWAYVYYMVKLDLADAYISLGNFSQAVHILEEVKEDWQVPNHPKLHFLKAEECYLAMELRWVEGLAYGYSQLNETTRLSNHLLEHVQKSLISPRSYREYYRESLGRTTALCQRFLPA